jgi:sensor histidine kinase YesM
MLSTDLYAQNGYIFHEDILPSPEINFKDWDKSYMPISHFKNGSELVASVENGVSCKVISYTLSTTDIGGFHIDTRVESNKLERVALKLFNQMPNRGRLNIEDVLVQYDDGTIRKVKGKSFIKIENEFEHFIESALISDPLNKDFGVFKSNIRIKLTGSFSEEDTRIVNELISEINPLLKKVTIKKVESFPNIILDFKKSDFNGVWNVSDTIINPLFPTLKKREILLKVNASDLSYRKAVISKAIIGNLAQFNKLDDDWKESLILGYNHQEKPSELTEFDKDLIKLLYSSKGQEKLLNIKKVKFANLADNTLLILILSFLIFFAFSELNSKFHFLNIFKFSKYELIQNIAYSLLIIQIPIFLLLVFNFQEYGFSFKLLLTYEISIGIFAFIVSLLLLFVDIVKNKTKSSGASLLLDSVLVILVFLISYQLTYLLIAPEFLKIGIIKKQWLIIPIAIISYRFYIESSRNKISNMLRDKELELVKQKEISLKSELLALQSRINPHFLYNSLNSIASLINKDAEKTEKMTIALANLFRYNTNKGNETFSTVEKEIENVKIYLDVEMVRFSDRLKYNVEVEENLIDAQIPVFILQPLVENAIKHGISQLTENGLIQLKIYSENNWIVISVYDNGPEFPKDIMMNYGLQSVFDKLTLLYKDSYEVNFINLPEKNIRIRINRK